jgi:DNA-binding transcriptional regulator YhcF (GntR family)
MSIDKAVNILGYFVEDDQLPAVKDVVSSIAINPNTFLTAYREL